MDAALADDRTAKAITGQMKNKPNQNEYLVSSSDVLRGAVTEGRTGQMTDKNCCRDCAGAIVASGCAGRISGNLLPSNFSAVARRTDCAGPCRSSRRVGAAAGDVRQRVEVLVTQPSTGCSAYIWLLARTMSKAVRKRWH
ncbi:MAG: hypothetical protein CM15mP100_2150 [Alphaproteobacteria bacterium]|nr:MAG: hypothetical protein CM15mP100_2150 [Alphaproteobacteria bacterium]